MNTKIPMTISQRDRFKAAGFKKGPFGSVTLRACEVAVFAVYETSDFGTPSWAIYVRNAEPAGAFWRGSKPLLRVDSIEAAREAAEQIYGIAGSGRFLNVIDRDGIIGGDWEARADVLQGEPLEGFDASGITITEAEVPQRVAELRTLREAGKVRHYYTLALMLYRMADAITKEVSAFSDFEDLLKSARAHGYKPSLNTKRDPRCLALAEIFDAACEFRGIASRAYRW